MLSGVARKLVAYQTHRHQIEGSSGQPGVFTHCMHILNWYTLSLQHDATLSRDGPS